MDAIKAIESGTTLPLGTVRKYADVSLETRSVGIVGRDPLSPSGIDRAAKIGGGRAATVSLSDQAAVPASAPAVPVPTKKKKKKKRKCGKIFGKLLGVIAPIAGLISGAGAFVGPLLTALRFFSKGKENKNK